MKAIPPELGENRIVVIEGIAGSGKDTMQRAVEHEYKKRGFEVYTFAEEELLYSWKHVWLPIFDVRLNLMHTILDYCEELLKENEQRVIILNRFHLTYTRMALIHNIDYKEQAEYQRLLSRLKDLPTMVLVAHVNEAVVEKRSAHPEREDPQWERHRKKRLAITDYDSFGELYKDEQAKLQALVKEQGIPSQVFELTS